MPSCDPLVKGHYQEPAGRAEFLFMWQVNGFIPK
jgi:hypothetical protein